MKLTLKNFRCYTHETFEFDDDTITLISGPSGHGKTTILLAIQFALYGSTNHKYLVSHNKTSCEVELEYKNFKIKRTKRPNILNVEVNKGSEVNKFEDKEAQVILNKYFGVTNSSVFFMDLSTDQKMEFLEKIANAECDVKDLKNKIKLEISGLNKEFAILDGQISNTESMLNIIQKPEKVARVVREDFFSPNSAISHLSKEELEMKKDEAIKMLEQETLKQNKYNGLIVEQRVLREEIASLNFTTLSQDDPLEEIENLNVTLNKLKAENNHLNKLKEIFLIIEESMNELENYKHIDDTDLTTVTQAIENLDQEIKQSVQNMDIQSFKKLQGEYDELLSQEMFEHTKKVDSLQNQINLVDAESRSNSVRVELDQLYTTFKSVQMFNIKEIEDEIEALKIKFFKQYNCIFCKHPFVINMDTFEMVQPTSPINTSLETMVNNIDIDHSVKIKLQKLEKLRDTFKQYEHILSTTNIEEITHKINLNKNYNKLILQLEQFGSFKPSLSLVKMKKNISKLKAKFKNCEFEKDVKEDVKEDVKDINILKDERRDLTIQLNTLSHQLKIKKNLIGKVETQKEHYDFKHHSKVLELIEITDEKLRSKNIELERFKNKDRLLLKLSLLTKEIDALLFNIHQSTKLESLIKEIDSGVKYHHLFDNYRSFQSQLKKYKKAKETLNEFIDSKERIEQTYLKTLLFKKKVIEAEQESLQFMVNIINIHLDILLQDFFAESFGDPIQIYLELESVKRPQVNIIINYKGNKIDYKSLSTGEYARVKLAFDLTFKEILGENIIMLDECTANLDQDLSTKIFNKIKDSFPSKTILVVAHQVVMGTFDNVLKIGIN
jgi:ABC-type lipoprotein export system ATPase subunit/ribosome-binding protein aMBF1 (putative translation factor)